MHSKQPPISHDSEAIDALNVNEILPVTYAINMSVGREGCLSLSRSTDRYFHVEVARLFPEEVRECMACLQSMASQVAVREKELDPINLNISIVIMNNQLRHRLPEHFTIRTFHDSK